MVAPEKLYAIEPSASIARSNAAVNSHTRVVGSLEAVAAVALRAAVVYRSLYCPCARLDVDAAAGVVVPRDGVFDEDVAAVRRQIDVDAISSEPADDATLDVQVADRRDVDAINSA